MKNIWFGSVEPQSSKLLVLSDQTAAGPTEPGFLWTEDLLEAELCCFLFHHLTKTNLQLFSTLTMKMCRTEEQVRLVPFVPGVFISDPVCSTPAAI